MNLSNNHAEGCDWAAYELCTCGLHARLSAERAARSREALRVQRVAEDATYRQLRRRWAVKRVAGKLAFFAFVYVLYAWAPWVGGSVFGLYFAGMSLLWLVEAHGPLYSDPDLRGPFKYLKWVFF